MKRLQAGEILLNWSRILISHFDVCIVDALLDQILIINSLSARHLLSNSHLNVFFRHEIFTVTELKSALRFINRAAYCERLVYPLIYFGWKYAYASKCRIIVCDYRYRDGLTETFNAINNEHDEVNREEDVKHRSRSAKEKCYASP